MRSIIMTCLIFLIPKITLAQNIDNQKLLAHFLNDDKIINFFHFEKSSPDTLFIVDYNYLLPDIQDESLPRPIKIIRDTELNLKIAFASNPNYFFTESKKWKNTIWLRFMVNFEKYHLVDIYSGETNKGGRVIYKERGKQLIGDYSKLGVF